jgi:tetratricopeptide (TPR) repeat protein
MSRLKQQQDADVSSNKGFLLKRKDFLGVDELAHSHPNRTYYYRKNNDLDDIIETCTRKLQVYDTFSLSALSLPLPLPVPSRTVNTQNDPRNVNALYLRGNSYAKKRFFDEGIRDFDVLLSLQPSHVDALYNRGKALPCTETLLITELTQRTFFSLRSQRSP